MKQTTITCDRCGSIDQTGMVSYVDISFGGSGAAKDKIDGIDLCRQCYGNLVMVIRKATSKLDTPSQITPNQAGS